MPLILPPTPCASRPNLLAKECIHTLQCFGWVISFWYFNNFPDSSSNTSFAKSAAAVGSSSMTACAHSVMLSGSRLCVDRPLLTMLARAWVYLEQIVGPLMGTVHSGLLTVAVTTLGACAVLGDCCKLPLLCPTLGSGMGSLKVTLFFLSTDTVVVLFKMSFIFCNTAITSFPRMLTWWRNAPWLFDLWASPLVVLCTDAKRKPCQISSHYASSCKKNCGSGNALLTFQGTSHWVSADPMFFACLCSHLFQLHSQVVLAGFCCNQIFH